MTGNNLSHSTLLQTYRKRAEDFPNDFERRQEVLSGERRWGVRKTVESCPRIDIRQWHRKGFLVLRRSFSWSVGGQETDKLFVTVEEGRAVLRFHHPKLGPLTEPIPLERTPCHYGGERSWFRCPGGGRGRQCGRRVALLYQVALLFLCRQCHGLVHKSQQVDRTSRLETKARKIRRRLGGNEDLRVPFPLRPKRMHRQTYERVRHEAAKIALALLMELKGRLHRR
jgi:hypothetical protein